MRRLVEVNTVAGRGSTGTIAEAIARVARESGEWEAWLAYGREPHREPSAANLMRIGSDWDMRWHGLESRLFDNHGLASKGATRRFLRELAKIEPDIVHLHNIHGYYLNYELLFEWLRAWGGPVVWTLHDCWPFTGHCAYYSYAHCMCWQEECDKCPQLRSYPASLFYDRSRQNFEDKQHAFLSCDNVHLVTVSDWLRKETEKSFLSKYEVITIHNGLDTSIFRPKGRPDRGVFRKEKLVLGVANVWDKRKGLSDFISLRNILSDDYKIVLIGLTEKQIETLPKGIRGITRTDNVDQLVDFYNMADVYVNTSVEETLGMTTAEALACGTPAVVYNSTACPEVVSKDTGYVVSPGDIEGLKSAILRADAIKPEDCRERVLTHFNAETQYRKYIELYSSII